MTKLITTLLASSLLLAGCFGEKKETSTTSAADLQIIAAKCSELSGYTGEAMHTVGVSFVFRADNGAVAECEWTSTNDVKLIELLY